MSTEEREPTLYELLEVSPNDSFVTIRESYRRLVKQFHPSNRETGSVEKFRKLTDAYCTLTDRDRRAEYNKTIS